MISITPSIGARTVGFGFNTIDDNDWDRNTHTPTSELRPGDIIEKDEYSPSSLQKSNPDKHFQITGENDKNLYLTRVIEIPKNSHGSFKVVNKVN
ncbi:MAG: hypothetical protein A2Y25_04470 [Candidatus Melainabacteria bacterium GWF2_37_15]|nr:MAG: hypothetical protein A2Y25_04470 [Candidatus Melainabacteria bacterium GWF2_37_15]